MNEKEAIQYVKELGMFKFKLLTDGTLFFETLKPFYKDGCFYDVEIQFYIKDKQLPTIFCYSEITDFKSNELQLAEINLVNYEQLYFSEYKH